MSDIKVDLRKFAEKRADEVIKVDLSKQPIKEEEGAVQEQETDDGVLRSSSGSEEGGEEAEMGLQEVREETKEEEVEQPAEADSVLTEVKEEEVEETPS